MTVKMILSVRLIKSGSCRQDQLKIGTSTVKGSLRAVAIIITVISLITFSTIGYSVFREYQSISSPASVNAIRASAGIQGTNVVFSVSGRIPNSGLYPIDLSFSVTAQSGGSVISKSDSASVRLLPGEDKTVNLTSRLDLFSLNNIPNPQRFLLNQTTITLLTTLTAGLEPFASISIGSPSNVTLPPPMGDFKVGRATVTSQGSQSLISIPVSFVNMASFQYPFTMYANMSSGQAVLGNSTTYNGLSSAGQQTKFFLSLTLPSSQVRAGTYQLIIHVIVLNNNIPFKTSVVVP